MQLQDCIIYACCPGILDYVESKRGSQRSLGRRGSLWTNKVGFLAAGQDFLIILELKQLTVAQIRQLLRHTLCYGRMDKVRADRPSLERLRVKEQGQRK